MKNRKAIILIALVLAISVFTIGCAKEENENKGTEIGEQELDKVVDEEVEVD